ncbi:MAG: GyrI-like domain-containing protein [Bacteroidales bacterium]|nr:GyrI-like domain-containing protein [Bacteroidales bacterium]
MRTRTVKSFKALKFTTKATLKDLDKYTGQKPNELYIEAQKLGFQTCESQVWQYFGADGKPDTEFTLEILLPIQGEGNGSKSENFEIVQVPEFKCLSKLHEGPWSEIGPVYCEMMKYCFANNLKYNLISREVYIRCDFEDQSNCITEIQIGII